MVRCPTCFVAVYDQRFIHPAIRGRDLRYPAELDRLPPWDITETVFIGPGEAELAKFKRMAWRSLGVHRDTGLQYVYLTLGHLIEITLDKDATYARGTVWGRPLLILLFGTGDYKSEYTSHILTQALYVRRERGLASWLFSSQTPAQIGEKYGYEVKDLLPAQRKAY
jgi:hypothetical protein